MSRTRQEIFDLAWNGLKAQGFERSGDDDGCFYRGPNGLRCAIGHVVPDDKYSANMEGRSASMEDILDAAGISNRDGGFVEELQECHDNGGMPARMEQYLRAFAANHSLIVLDELVLPVAGRHGAGSRPAA